VLRTHDRREAVASFQGEGHALPFWHASLDFLEVEAPRLAAAEEKAIQLIRECTSEPFEIDKTRHMVAYFDDDPSQPIQLELWDGPVESNEAESPA